jgi:beta-glucosidase/6-phospho-beta-glucosidase/beta-galactosidase
VTRATPLAALVLLAACGEKPAPALTFPSGFTWGAAISGFQVEMGCPTLPAADCEDRHSDWYEFITSGQLGDLADLMSGDTPSQGPGHFELYDADFARASDELGLSSVRFSIEWSRIFPTPTDGIEGFDALKAMANPEALAHYHAVFASLKAHRLKPLVTLNHYTLPVWVHDAVGCHQALATCTRRGWLDQERIVREIAKYAGFVGQEFAGDVDTWATLNEPFAIVLPGYLLPGLDRANPPAVRFQYAAAKQAFVAMVEAHARMYDAIKAADDADADADGVNARVGLVYSVTPTRPKNPENPLDRKGAENVFYLYNTAFLDGVILGQLDADLSKKPMTRPDLQGRMDYLGLNYYTRITVEGTDSATFPALSIHSNFNPLTLVVWEEYPRGLYDVLMHLEQRYHLPTIVTESGISDPADDGAGSRWLSTHLAWAQAAITDGAQLSGFYYWSLFDNFEWNHGMNERFGLYAVDKADPAKVRTPRKTVEAYRRIVTANRVPDDLAATFPIERP